MASDGYAHAWRFWPSVGKPRGLIVALHGIQSHSGWYGESAGRLAERGFALAYLDRRGSGLNAQSRGDAPHAERLINDVVQFASFFDRRGLRRVPRWLMGTSWGGKLALLIAAQYRNLFDGVILQSPAVRPRIRERPWQRLLLRAAEHLGGTRREVPIPLADASLFCDAPAFQEYIRADRHSLRRVTVRFLGASWEIDRRLRAARSRIECPILTLLAGRDRIVNNVQTEQFLAECASRQQTTMVFPDACHTLEFAQNRDEILANIIGWLEETDFRRSSGTAVGRNHGQFSEIGNRPPASNPTTSESSRRTRQNLANPQQTESGSRTRQSLANRQQAGENQATSATKIRGRILGAIR